MSFDNNNSSTSAPLLECFYRNKYERIYWELISVIPTEKPRTLKTEEHHIVPKCLGGHPKDKRNLCYPTLRQHFVLHRLLNKMYPDHEGLFYAIFRMSCSGNSYTYSHLRSNYVRSKGHNQKISDSLKGQKLSDSRKLNISRARLSSNKVPKGVNHPGSNKILENRKNEIREIWRAEGKPGDVKLGQLLGMGTGKNSYRCKTLQRFIKDFKEEDIV
jgi:hypothetical protein